MTKKYNMSYLVHHFKVLKDYLFLLMMQQVMVMMKQVQKVIESIFFQEQKLKIIMY